MNDPLETFFATDFATSAPRNLRHNLLQTTTRLLGRRRRWRRLAWSGAFAACFLAGMATMGLWQNLDPSHEQTDGPRDNILVTEQQHEKTAAPPAAPEPSAGELEWRAFDSRDNRSALFFEAAQRVL